MTTTRNKILRTLRQRKSRRRALARRWASDLHRLQALMRTDEAHDLFVAVNDLLVKAEDDARRDVDVPIRVEGA